MRAPCIGGPAWTTNEQNGSGKRNGLGHGTLNIRRRTTRVPVGVRPRSLRRMAGVLFHLMFKLFTGFTPVADSSIQRARTQEISFEPWRGNGKRVNLVGSSRAFVRATPPTSPRTFSFDLVELNPGSIQHRAPCSRRWRPDAAGCILLKRPTVIAEP